MATGSAGAEKETAPDFVEIDGIAKSFRDRRVLDDVRLGIAPGSLVAVLGASGSGKTTLLRLIAGFERADAGSIRIGGRAVAGPGLHAKVETRGIGYVAQEGALFPHLDVAGNILFGLARHERRDRVRAGSLLETVGLSPAYAGRRPAELSGGEQQRVALARALARRPSLVLLDEPFSALDAALRAETRDAVGRALAASGATALLVTHDQPEALSMGARVAVLRGGRLAQVAEPRTLYRRPVDAALACFVGEAVLLAGEIGGGMARSALGTHAVHVAETWGLRMAVGAACLMLRPEQLVLDAAPRPDGTILAHDTRVTARVVAVAFHGSDARVRLVLTDGTEVTSRVNGHRAPEPGAEVAIGVDGEMVAYPPDSLRDQR